MTNDNDSGFVDRIVENVKTVFGGGSNDTEDLQDTELAAEARGEGAGDVSGSEADVNMFGSEGDSSVGSKADERARVGTSDSGSAGSTYESSQPGAGFATDSADTAVDPYANTPGTGFATGAIPTTIPGGSDADYGSAASGLSTEPSLGEGDAGAVGAPVGEDVSLEERSGI